ncbi:MAG: hypothetical protein PUP93_33160 [Rhizonema sp. NSF051]|nr:hypothetical protein [Rhizonema sp. NSF051]
MKRRIKRRERWDLVAEQYQEDIKNVVVLVGLVNDEMNKNYSWVVESQRVVLASILALGVILKNATDKLVDDEELDD